MNSTLPGCISFYGSPLAPNDCDSCKHADLCKRITRVIKSPAIRVIDDYTLDGGDVLACPTCGFEYVHPISLEVATGEYHAKIDSRGVKIRYGESAETVEAKQNRGAIIHLQYFCENSHHGKIVLSFHKGNTYVSHEDLPFERVKATLWRS